MRNKKSKTVILRFRVLSTVAEKISEWAEASDMDVPDYLRRVVERGTTFSIGVNDQSGNESPIVERIEDSEDQPKRRHAAG